MYHLSVLWHMIPLKCSSWNITLWTKKVHQSTNFQIFECFNESLPNSSCQIWNHKVNVYSSLYQCSVSWKITLIFCIFILLTKRARQVKFSDFRVVGWKFNKFFMSCLKLQVSFSLNFASLFNVMRYSSSILF